MEHKVRNRREEKAFNYTMHSNGSKSDASNIGTVSFEFFLDHVWNHPRQKGGWLWAQIANASALSFQDAMCSQVNLLSEGQSLDRPPVEVLQHTRKRRLAQRLHKFTA
eukprot:2117032-Amphidinium_carterae.3